MITDGKRFIYRNRRGQYIPTTCEPWADKFTRRNAEQILNNSVSKKIRAGFRVERYDTKNVTPPENVKQVDKTTLQENTEKVMMTDEIKHWLNRLADLNGLVGDATKRRHELKLRLNEIEDEIQDLLHFAEFSKLNAAQLCVTCKDIKRCRVERRSIKNEIQVLDIILEQKVGDVIADEIIKKVQGMDNRTYSPRIRTDLFNL